MENKRTGSIKYPGRFKKRTYRNKKFVEIKRSILKYKDSEISLETKKNKYFLLS